MCKKTGKASWISSFQKSSGLDASKKPQCSPHSDCKPAAEEPSIEMNGNGTHRDLIAEVEYHTTEPSSRLTMFG